MLVQAPTGAFELMHATIGRLASKEIVGFLKKKTQRQWNLRGDPGGWEEEKNARTQGRKDAKVVDLP